MTSIQHINTLKNKIYLLTLRCMYQHLQRVFKTIHKSKPYIFRQTVSISNGRVEIKTKKQPASI